MDRYFDTFVCSHASHIYRWIPTVTSRIRSFVQDVDYGPRSRLYPIRLVGKFEAGDAWSTHAIADYRSMFGQYSYCLWYSFELAGICTFDIELVNEWRCHGAAFDASIEHRWKLHSNTTFDMIAARTLLNERNREWLLVSTVPNLQLYFGHASIDIIEKWTERVVNTR